MKKRFLAFSIVSSVLTSTLVAAQIFPAPPIAFNQVKEVLSNFLIGTSVGGADIWARLLLLLLMTVILIKPIEKVLTQDRRLAFLIAFFVSLLGIRYLSNTELLGVLLPYSALMIILSIIGPLILLGTLLSTSGIDPTLRKVMWGFTAGAFAVLWWVRWEELGNLSYIYLSGTIGAVLALFFFDEQISGLYYQSKIDREQLVDKSIASENITRMLKDLYGQYAASTDPTIQAQLMRRIRQQRNALKLLTKS
ncbi:hypothetical protein ACFLZZ_04600 [Nanoarchaeota archaeon]